MRSSTIVAMSAFSLALCSTAAWADPPATTAAKAPAAKGTYTLETTHISLRAPRPHVSVDINAVVQRAPLPELRQPLLERIGAAVEKDPF